MKVGDVKDESKNSAYGSIIIQHTKYKREDHSRKIL